MAIAKITIVRGAATDVIYADAALPSESQDRLVLLRGGVEVAWYRLSAIDGWVSEAGLKEQPEEDE